MKYLIDFKNSATDSEILDYLNTNNCSVLKEWDNFDKVYLVDVLTVPPTTDIVEFVVLDEPKKIKPLNVIPLDPYRWCHGYGDFPKLECSNTDEKDWWKVYSYVTPNFDQPSTTISRKGAGVIVYLMDSGIERSHPEFTEADIEDLYTVSPGDFADHRGHGTALASVIVGKTCGISSAKVKNVKIYDAQHETLQSEILSAFDAIINDYDPSKFSILNCAWSIEKNAWVEHKIAKLVDMGVWVLAAAGNQGHSIDDVTPASMMEVITIGAYNKNLEPCSFSNYTGSAITSFTANDTNHGELDGWAPGENIWAAGLNGSYGYCLGTSIATAISSAILANNLAPALKDDGTKELFYGDMELRADRIVNSGHMLFGRYDLLEFKDDKYKESKNWIATIHDSCKQISYQISSETNGVWRVNEKNTRLSLFAGTHTKSIEFVDDLPENFYVMTGGTLYGNPTVAQGPTDGEKFKLYKIRYNRTSIDDVTELCTANIYILGENVDPAAELPPDHVINIRLSSCSGGAGFRCIFYTDYLVLCDSGCPTPLYCCGGFKGGYVSCNCAPSDRRLKTNIVRIGTHRLGIGLYEYDIHGGREIGVMADELLPLYPEAVSVDSSGYYCVNYDLIGRE